MSNIIPFDSKLPAHIKPTKVENAFAAAVGGGFKTLSIKSKVFSIVDGDAITMVTQKNDDGDQVPASSVQVVIVASNPHKSKVYYNAGYTEGSTEKPLCYSNNGIEPAPDATAAQAKKCAACPHNVFGSKITDNGSKAKACSDSMRLAVSPSGLIDDPMLLRVPAASLRALGSYGSELAARGVLPHQVVTKIGFDYSVAYPALTFKAVGFVSESMAIDIDKVRESEVVGQIIGTIAVPFESEPATPKAETPAPAGEPAAPAAPAKPAGKAKRATSLDQALDAAEANPPKASVKMEPPNVVVSDDLANEISAMLAATDD